MFEILRKIEAEEIIPDMLLDSGAKWNSLFVDYEKPHVERLWRQYGEYRINLHVIHSCDKSEALFHPHPWPSEIKIVSGEYEMYLADGPRFLKTIPENATKIILPEGSYYSMSSADAWHAVIPVGEASKSIMVTGLPYENIKLPNFIRPKTHMKPLAAERKNELLREWRDYFEITEMSGKQMINGVINGS